VLAGLETTAIAGGFLYVDGMFTTIDVPGAIDTTPSSINNAGQIVGNFSDSKGQHGFLDVGGTFSTIDVPGASQALANGINNAGHIVGSFVDSTGPQDNLHGFLDVGGTFSTIDVPGAFRTFANGINDAGHIVGYFDDSKGRFHGFLDVGGTLSTIDVPGAPFTSAFGINDAGQVAGHSQTSGGAWHAFRYTPGLGLQDLGTADAYSYASAINAKGQVVGRTERATGTHAFRYTDGIGIEDLHTLPAAISDAAGINNAGAVVGYAYTSGTPSRAFVYTDAEGMIDLNTRIDPASGWVLNAAWGINNSGEIVGQGTYGDQIDPRAFKLTPYVADVTAPNIAGATADPAILWPANLQMVSVSVAVDVTDNADPAPRCRIVDVVSSEPADNAAVTITGDLTLGLRAERSGSADGRTYRVNVACSDASGNVAGTTVAVRVPHDQSGAQNQ
jgi:probable HAF family extracellular repeat protein